MIINRAGNENLSLVGDHHLYYSLINQNKADVVNISN